MSPIEIFTVGLLVMFALIYIQIPVAYSMLLVGFTGYAVLIGFTPAASTLTSAISSNVSSISLAVVPLFMLMGSFTAAAGLSGDLYKLAERLIGHRPGGLAYATIAGCSVFGSVCGSSLATAATFGTVALPEMEKRNYSQALASGTIAVGGTLGALIPPSIILVIYAIMTESFILDMFVAAIVPVVLAVLLQFATLFVVTRIRPDLAPPGERFGIRERLEAVRDAMPTLGLIIVVLGGMYGGVFTVNEAAAIGAALSMILAVARRRITWQSFFGCLFEAGRNTGMIYLIIFGAEMMSYFVTITGAPAAFTNFVVNSGLPPYTIILCFVLLYILLGTVFDTIATMLITLPFFLPVVVELGYDVVWWGIVTLAVVELGMITPPFGMNVFVLRAVAPHVKLSTIFFGVTPFIVTDLLRIALLVAFPSLALYLLQFF